MNLRTLLLVVLIVGTSVFTLINWAAFTAPTTLSLVFGSVQAPLGLIMLALTGLVMVLFVVYIVYQQAGVIVEMRRATRDMAANRELADKAEASRFTELRAFLETELRNIESRIGAMETSTSQRIEAAEQALAARMTEAGNGAAAHVGQLEDKLEHMLANRS